MPQKEYFSVIYDGPILQSHEMDVRDLAPALLAISDMLDEANTIVYGDKSKVQVNVKGSFKTGSFGIEFSVIQQPLHDLISALNSDSVSAACNLLGLLGFIGLPGSGLIGLLVLLRNRKIKKITKDNGKATIYVDEENIVTEEKVIDLYASVKIRTSLQKVITEPLSKEGIETFATEQGGKINSISTDQKDYFKTPDVQDEPLKDETRTTFLSSMRLLKIENF
ncbi:MAG: hypothetical protein NT141_04080 [candidate division WWE3 bacterium]|nr:hypothetical protein [candidate division WWE3 bacterium]